MKNLTQDEILHSNFINQNVIFQYKNYIEEGDLVLAYISRSTIKPINVKKGEILIPDMVILSMIK